MKLDTRNGPLPILLASALLVAACSDGGGGEGGGSDEPTPDAAVSDAVDDTVVDDPVDDVDRDAVPVDAGDADAPDGSDAAPDVRPVAESFTVVELSGDASPELRIAVRACAGLSNRSLGGSVLVRFDEHDTRWMDELRLEPERELDAETFLDECIGEFGRCVRYDYDAQRPLLPNVLTVAAAEGAVPVDVDFDAECETAFDAIDEFAERESPEAATRLVYERYLDQTTGLAMLNPGYTTNPPNPADPALDSPPRTTMIDFVFSERLFVVFLINGCTPPHPENLLLEAIVEESGWSEPVGVYGYNNSWNVGGGYLHEAQTRCLASRNMGAIPTETGNLSFWSTRRAPITHVDELERTPAEDIAYDPASTYVAFVIGDGDNIRFMMTWRTQWLMQRLAACAVEGGEPGTCAPLTWSMSPHLARVAPDVLAWYYAALASTGADYLTLPPSGHQYAYPSSLAADVGDAFVAATERDARLLGVEGVVHWEWFDSWRVAQNEFLPKYATTDGAIRGIFPVSVPYMTEAFPWWGEDEFYRVLEGEDGGRAVVFRPRSWRGVNGTDNASEAEFFLSPREMADELAGYPPGTVTAIYMTSDGGLSLENSVMELVDLLPDRVRLVGADTASRLALEASNP